MSRAVSVSLMTCSSPCARARSTTSSGVTRPGGTYATGVSGAYMAVTAAEAVQAAWRLGTHRACGRAGRVRRTALGAVAAWTSIVSSPWPCVAYRWVAARTSSASRLLRIGRVHDAGGPHRKTPDAAEPGREAARPFGDGLHGVESRFGAFGPGHGDEPRDGVMAGRPVTEAVGEFGQTRFGGIAREERAYGMAHADHGVRRSAVHAGQEAGPPQGEHLAPGVLGELAAEVTDPVGRAARVAQGLAPAGCP